MYRQKKGRGVGGKEKAPLKSQGEIWEICGRLKNCLEKKSDSSQSVRQKNCCPCTRPSPHFPSGPPSKPAGAGSRTQTRGSNGKKTPRNFSKFTHVLLTLTRYVLSRHSVNGGINPTDTFPCSEIIIHFFLPFDFPHFTSSLQSLDPPKSLSFPSFHGFVLTPPILADYISILGSILYSSKVISEKLEGAPQIWSRGCTFFA